MRVLYSFPHTLGKPGISTTAFHQIEGLIAQGITVDVVCTNLGRELPGARRIIETLTVAGRRVPHRALGVHRAYGYHDRRAARILERLRSEVDLVHAWPAACLRTFAAARRVGVPSFREVPSAHTQTAYEDAAREADSLGLELPPGHHHRYDASQLDRELREFAAVDYLLVPSAYVERTFVERGHSPEQLIRHRYGYDPLSFGRGDVTERTNGAGLTAVFVGRGEPNKGLHHALQAWADSGAAERGHLLICGDVLPSYRERIAPLLAHPSVQELGFVPDVGRVMQDADVLLLPSVTEGSALVTYEAQAAGCALLVSEAAGAPCDHLEHGLVHAPGDVTALTEHLRRVDRDPELLHELQTRALANAANLTWAAAGARLAAAYAEGLGRFRSRNPTSAGIINRPEMAERPVGDAEDGHSASVRSITDERWREAQQWELDLWQKGQRKRGWKRIVWPVVSPALRALNWRRAWGDDWNHWWKERFDDYAFLPSDVGDCIELGCGPYTNTRLILEKRRARQIVCSDPLVRSYITFRGRWLAEAYAAGRIEIDDHPIEECPFPPGAFDLVVMINVLDHVRDADLCMQKAIELVRPGGYFIIGQDLSDEEDIAHHPYDVGHPIRLRREDLDPYLEPLSTVLHKDLSRNEGRDPRLHYGTLIHVGRKPQ